MTPKQLQALLSLTESSTLEFKRDLSSQRNIVRTIVAFANSAGGKLIVGVSDKEREIVGVGDPIAAKIKLANIVMLQIAPSISPDIEIHTLAGKNVIVLTVRKGESGLHYLADAGLLEGTYTRVGTKNRKAVTSTFTVESKLDTEPVPRLALFDDRVEIDTPDLSQTSVYVRFTIWFDSSNSNLGSAKETKETKLETKETKYREQILKYAAQPRTRAELLEYIGLYNNTKNASRHILPLIEEGSLLMTQPDKPNSRSQRYVSKSLRETAVEPAPSESEAI